MTSNRRRGALASAPTRTAPQVSAEETEEAARYIAQLCAELAHMASAKRLDMLAYFLTMARTEAEVEVVRAEARRP